MKQAVTSLSGQLDRIEKQEGGMTSADVGNLQRLLTDIKAILEKDGKE